MHVGLDLPNVEGRKVIAGHRLGWLGATVVTTTPNKGWHKTGRKTLEADVQDARMSQNKFLANQGLQVGIVTKIPSS